MIVVDTNVIAYFCIPGQQTKLADRISQQDNQWAAPLLWRSEFRNVLAGFMRRDGMSRQTAYAIVAKAEKLFDGTEFPVQSEHVLELVDSSSCSAYDCEFVALGMELGVHLVTTDSQILKEFPTIAVHPSDFTG